MLEERFLSLKLRNLQNMKSKLLFKLNTGIFYSNKISERNIQFE